MRWRGLRTSCGPPLASDANVNERGQEEERHLEERQVHASIGGRRLERRCLYKSGDGGGSVFASNFRCSSTFLIALGDTQRTALYKGLESSRGVRVCYLA